MRVVIFGLGSIGSRHAKILLKNFGHKVYAYRSSRKGPANRLGLEELYSRKDLEASRSEIAFITNPTFLHVGTALECASLGMHLFIEKPLSHNLNGIDKLESICRRKKLTCYVAYGLRFHPVIKKIRALMEKKKALHARVVCSSYLPGWKAVRDLKKDYSLFKNKGGGVLFELSHELDYIRYIFGNIKTIKGSVSRISKVTVDAGDCADLLIALDGDSRVNLHLDLFSHISERSIKVDFQGGYIIGDLIRYTVEYFNKGRKQVFKFKIDRNEYLKKEIEYFFANVGNPFIMNNLHEAGELLRKIVKVKNG